MENKSRKCPHCGAKLNEDNIGFYSENIVYSRIHLEKGILEYEPDGTEMGKSGFYCRECGADLSLNKEEVKEILKEVASESDDKNFS